MNDNPKYVMYRNKRIPRWWEDYLPEEKNPYKKEDILTLEVGCLSDYWHIHSSNKHPNYKGAEACNAVQEMVYYHFGGAFLSGGGGYGGQKGQKRYHEPEHLYYENAYLEDGKIHIKDAWQYYEDVITFVLRVLQTVSSNHMQSGMDYDAKGFFPVGLMTDAQVEEAQKANRLRKEKTKLVESTNAETIRRCIIEESSRRNGVFCYYTTLQFCHVVIESSQNITNNHKYK